MKSSSSLKILAVLLILTGCAAPACPPMHQFTPEEQKLMAAGLRTLPTSSPLYGLVDAYASEDGQLKAASSPFWWLPF